MGINQGARSSGALKIGNGETAWKSRYMKLIEDAAESAAASAETAKAAEAGAIAALEAGVHLPVPGENGNWQIWDAEAGGYVDSGEACRSMPDTGLPKGGAAGQIPVKKSAADYDAAWQYPQYSRPNLLDNWYFVGGGSQKGDGVFPINQRRETIISGDVSIDRWYCNADISMSVVDAGIRLTASGTAEPTIYQKLFRSGMTKLLGRTLTFSVLAADNVYGVTAAMPDTIPGAGLTFGETNTPFGFVRLQYVTGSSGLLAVIGVTADTTVLIQAAKLEIGDYQTLAHQDANGDWVLNELPDFGAELTKCQRYLQRIENNSLFIGMSRGSRQLFCVPLTVPMAKANPTTIGLNDAAIVTQSASINVQTSNISIEGAQSSTASIYFDNSDITDWSLNAVISTNSFYISAE